MLLAAIDGPLAFLMLLVGLGFIIFVHELGHFLVAKAVGIRCTQFALGFGHALFSWRKGVGLRLRSTEPEYGRRIVDYLNGRLEQKPNLEEHYKFTNGIEPSPIKAVHDLSKLPSEDLYRASQELGLGETEYRFNWMPLGGYVKMLGQEDLDPAKVSSDPRSYNMKPVWARMCVISAGVIMNLLFGALFFVIAFMIGVDFPPAQVGSVLPGSPAAVTAAVDRPDVIGLRPGDEIIAINDKKPSDFNSIKVAVGLSDSDAKIRFKVRRPDPDDSHGQTLNFILCPSHMQKGDLPSVGIGTAFTRTLMDSPKPKDHRMLVKALEPFGLKPGWTLTAVNGQPIQHQWQYTNAIADAAGQPLQATFTRPDGSTTDITVTPSTDLQTVDVEPVTGFKTGKEIITHLIGLVAPMEIVSVEKNTPADGVLQPGDIVTAIGRITWPTIGQFRQTIKHAANQPVHVTLLRNGKRVEGILTPQRKFLKGLIGPGRIGVGMNYDTQHTRIASIRPDSPFQALAGKLMPGSVIRTVNGRPVADFRDLRLAFQAAGDSPIKLDVIVPVGGGTADSLELTLDETARQTLKSLAWIDPIGLFSDLKVTQKAHSPFAAISMGIDKTVLFLRQTYLTIVQLARRQLAFKQMMGPIGIVNVGQRFASEGLSYLLFFMGLLSVNLAVINFLPIPIVDGGHFILLTIETLRGKPVSLKVQQAATMAGLAIILVIFATVTYYDIARIVSG